MSHNSPVLRPVAEASMTSTVDALSCMGGSNCLLSRRNPECECECLWLIVCCSPHPAILVANPFRTEAATYLKPAANFKTDTMITWKWNSTGNRLGSREKYSPGSWLCQVATFGHCGVEYSACSPVTWGLVGQHTNDIHLSYLYFSLTV
jgi:hypothetical protein